MPDPAPVKLDGHRLNNRVVFLLAGVFLIIATPLVGYYASSYYSANRVTVDIVSGARTLGNPINYTLLIQITVPNAIMSVELWTPTVTLFLDSFNLGGVFPCHTSVNSADLLQLTSKDNLTCRGYWRSSFADYPGQPSAEAALNQTSTNQLVLWVYFHQAEAGWYNQEMLKTVSTVWTWT